MAEETAIPSGPSFPAELFYDFAEQAPVMMFLNLRGRLQYVNPQCEKTMGYTRQEFLEPGFDFLDLVADDHKPLVRSQISKNLDGQDVPPFVCLIRTKDGRLLTSLIQTKLVLFQGDRAVFGVISDISYQKDIEKALRESEHRYRLTIDNLSEAIHVVDPDLRIILMNESFRKWNRILGLRTDLEGLNIFEAFPFLHAKVRKEYQEVFRTGRVLRTEETNDVGGKPIITETRKIPIYEGEKVIRVITSITNITDRKIAEQQLEEANRELKISIRKLRQLALRDSHTGLYNHRYLSEALASVHSQSERTGQPFSLILLDIDYFKSINDVYGHRFGDLILRQFGDKLRKIMRRYNIVIRYGGEEFIIIAPSSNRSKGLALAQRLLETIGITPFGNSRNSIKLKFSAAVVSWPEDKTGQETDLIERADQILAKAKEFGGNRVYTSLNLKKAKRKKGSVMESTPDMHYLKEKMERLNKRANQSLIEAILAFAKTIELKDHYTGEHAEMTVSIASRVAERMGLNRDEVHWIKQAAILHDLGKIGVSDKILLKPDKLTADELEKIMEHPVIGADIIRPIHMLHTIVPYILYHHERWDGKGYPMGLKGEEIPLGARIIALSDVYQALTSNRPYRKSFTKQKALDIVRRESGRQFDPKVVKAFLSIVAKLKMPKKL